MEVLGTRSRTPASAVDAAVVAVGVNGVVMRQVVGWRKMGRGAEREGRRLGRWEKVLFCFC